MVSSFNKKSSFFLVLIFCSLFSHFILAGSPVIVQTKVQIAVCGNLIKEPSEECDGPDLGVETCEDKGFHGGSLGCYTDCSLDFSRCSNVVSSGSHLSMAAIETKPEVVALSPVIPVAPSPGHIETRPIEGFLQGSDICFANKCFSFVSGFQPVVKKPELLKNFGNRAVSLFMSYSPWSYVILWLIILVLLIVLFKNLFTIILEFLRRLKK